MRRFTVLMLAFLVVFGAVDAAAQDGLTFGVLAKRGEDKAIEQWGPLADYLTEQIGQPVTLKPLPFEDVEAAVAAGHVDLILANSGFFVDLQAAHGIRAIATMKNRRQNRALDVFAGVILAKNGSPITTVADLAGKNFMCVSTSSFGGGQMAFRHMIEKSVNPFQDVILSEGGSHDAVVLAVKAGTVDAGTVRSDTLERMASEGQIGLADFQIIEPNWDDGFPFAHTTQTYPEWPMAATANVDDAVVAKVGTALQALSEEHPAAQAAKIVGWSKPLDYAPVADCLRVVSQASGAAR